MKRLIIFDSDKDILSVCGYVLEQEGWQVFTFENCEDLEARVSAIRPDLILMDDWIGPAGGAKATRTLKGSPKLRAIPVIYFSANSDIKALAEAAGADSYLEKPFDLEELVRLGIPAR